MKNYPKNEDNLKNIDDFNIDTKEEEGPKNEDNPKKENDPNKKPTP